MENEAFEPSVVLEGLVEVVEVISITGLPLLHKSLLQMRVDEDQSMSDFD